MYILIDHTVILLLTTALLFYLLPKVAISWQTLFIVVWLLGVSWMLLSTRTAITERFSNSHFIEV